MRSRALSCNGRLLSKALTRYAPAWMGYSVILLLIVYGFYLSEGLYDREYTATVLSGLLSPAYGFVCAMSLFGYLTRPRECNMLHALPVRREQLFAVHVLAAAVMSLVPNTLFLLANPEYCHGADFWFFLGRLELEFLYHFAMTTFCMLLTGRRLAAYAVMLLLNSGPMLVYAFLYILYLPLLPGVVLDSEVFLTGSLPELLTPDAWELSETMVTVRFGLLGLVLLGVALVLYRRRRLEYAGDFLAVKCLEPVFLIAVSLSAGCAAAAFGYLFDGSGYLFPLGLGLLVGWFGSLMLMKRTVKVFRPRSLLGGAAMLMLVFGSIFLVDGFSDLVVRHIPEAERVEAVEIHTYLYSSDSYISEDPGVISDVMELHSGILEKELDIQSTGRDGLYVYDTACETIYITYHLTNGSELCRSYRISDPHLVEQAGWYLSQPAILLGVDSLQQLLDQLQYIQVTDQYDKELGTITGSRQESFLHTFFEEAQAGKLYSANYRSGGDGLYRVRFQLRDHSVSVWITGEAAETLELLERYFPSDTNQ